MTEENTASLASRLEAEHERRWKAFFERLNRGLGQHGRHIKAEVKRMAERRGT